MTAIKSISICFIALSTLSFGGCAPIKHIHKAEDFKPMAAGGNCKNGGLLVDLQGKFKALTETKCNNTRQEEEPCLASNDPRPYCTNAGGIYEDASKRSDMFSGTITIYQNPNGVLWEPMQPTTCCALWGYKTDSSGNRIPFCLVPKAC